MKILRGGWIQMVGTHHWSCASYHVIVNREWAKKNLVIFCSLLFSKNSGICIRINKIAYNTLTDNRNKYVDLERIFIIICSIMFILIFRAKNLFSKLITLTRYTTKMIYRPRHRNNGMVIFFFPCYGGRRYTYSTENDVL